MEQTELLIESTLDGTMQPSLFFKSEGEEKRPLLVSLHTWSFNRYSIVKTMLPLAEKLGFNLLLPEFRGPNLAKNPNCNKACGSEFAMRDIKDAIDYLISNDEIDKDNVFLLGQSGGGHMALMMAGYCPEYFKAIAAYVPITDLSKWAVENEKYRPRVIACCTESREEMLKRSPITYIDNIAKANLKIFHGKTDPVVPVSQSIDFYNDLIKAYPQARVFLDIFDGGHEIDLNTAEYWIRSQYKGAEKIDVLG